MFCKKILHSPESTKSTEKHKNNQANVQNANKRTKIKNMLKNILVGKSNLFTYLSFCGFFCAKKKKKKEKSYNRKCTKY